MSNIQTGAERMPHDLSHLGFLAGQIGRLITISTTPVIAGDSFEMDAVGALRLSPLRRGLAIDSKAFYDNPNALRDYFRDIGRMVLAAEGRKANDSHADCYQYFCVPEYGTANGRLHFHA